MSEPEIDIQVIKISPKVIGFRAVVKGKVCQRVYMGYKPTKALAAFKKWLKTQEV